MNPAALLALISDLYSQVSALSQENASLKRMSGPNVPAQESDLAQHMAVSGEVPRPNMAGDDLDALYRH